MDELEPGGPAALSGVIAPGDELVGITGADGVPAPVAGMDMDEVVRLLRGGVGTSVTLHLQRGDGPIHQVLLQRALIHPEAGRAQARVLHDGVAPIGLITLPRFYTDLSGGDGPRASADVSILLDSLMEAGIGGLMIDLRDNQGGSMSETIRMLGLFLDAGPVAQRLASDGALRVLSTSEPNARYRGPLVVLVNGHSASASEFFAAALQDHRRAVIMGGPHTYGKGTIQAMVDLPPELASDGTSTPAGAVKLTVALFFRPSGASVQRDGITPDIVLPGPHDVEPSGERALAHALSHPGIAPASYTPWSTEGPVPAVTMEGAHHRARTGITRAELEHIRMDVVTAPWARRAHGSNGHPISDDADMAHAWMLLRDVSATNVRR